VWTKWERFREPLQAAYLLACVGLERFESFLNLVEVAGFEPASANPLP
jgi:hypothetical protein